MFMTFEDFISEEINIEETSAYPSFFELVCLFPISGKPSLSETSFLLDEIDIF